MRRREQQLALRVDVFIHDERSRGQLIPYLEAIMSALDDLRAEVAESRTVTESAITLLQGLKQQLDEAIATGDPGALVELAADLDSQTNRLAEAVQLNTPQQPGGGDTGGGEGGEGEPGEGEPFPSEPQPESFGAASSGRGVPSPAGSRRRR